VKDFNRAPHLDGHRVPFGASGQGATIASSRQPTVGGATDICRPLPSRIAIAPPLPVLNGYLSNDNHCCYCPGVGLLKEFNRAPTSPPLLVRSAGCEAEGRKTEHQMEYRTLPLSCECGGVPKNISAVGLSSEHELVIHWRCPRCRRNVCTVKPLSDCWRECFTPASANLPNAKPTVDTAYDRRFLHRIGVKYSDE
jgi:hypothetical protein